MSKKLDRRWLRAMKIWGQDGNCNEPVYRREGKSLTRNYSVRKRIRKSMVRAAESADRLEEMFG